MKNIRTTTGVLCMIPGLWCVCVILIWVCPTKGDDRPRAKQTVSVELTLLTGGRVSGFVLDHTGHGLVVIADKTPFVFAWDELDPGSAYRAKLAVLGLGRRGDRELTAEDHFDLGRYMLYRDRNVVAVNEFNRAKHLDPSYAAKVERVLDQYRQSRAEHRAAPGPADLSEEAFHSISPEDETAGLVDALTGPSGTGANSSNAAPAQRRALIVNKIKAFFNERLPKGVGKGIELIETEHFLLWSGLPSIHRVQVAKWCEAMYEALCAQFGFSPSEHVFLGKCPVFCFRSKARFLNFARRFDGYGGKGAVGYTRSIEEKGYVHVVLFRQGRTELDLNRFASTLVHEASHAFMHRFHSHRLIPNWVNEGYAELVAERVLQDRCITGENAELLARQYVRYDWPIGDFLRSTGPIGVHQYPLAHSLIAYLESIDADAFAAFIRGLKDGMTTAQALEAAYRGMTLETLEARWRTFIRAGSDAGEVPIRKLWDRFSDLSFDRLESRSHMALRIGSMSELTTTPATAPAHDSPVISNRGVVG